MDPTLELVLPRFPKSQEVRRLLCVGGAVDQAYLDILGDPVHSLPSLHSVVSTLLLVLSPCTLLDCICFYTPRSHTSFYWRIHLLLAKCSLLSANMSFSEYVHPLANASFGEYILWRIRVSCQRIQPLQTSGHGDSGNSREGLMIIGHCRYTYQEQWMERLHFFAWTKRFVMHFRDINTMLGHAYATLCLRYTTPCYATLCYATPCDAVLCRATPCYVKHRNLIVH